MPSVRNHRRIFIRAVLFILTPLLFIPLVAVASVRSSSTALLPLLANLRDEDDKDDSPVRNQTPTFKPGSAGDAVYNFCVPISHDDTATASDYVSKSAKGVAERLREGELSEERIEELRSFMNPMTELLPVASKDTSKRSLRNKKNQSLSFTLRRENEVFRITDFTLVKPKK